MSIIALRSDKNRSDVTSQTVVGTMDTVANVIRNQEERGLLLAHSAIYRTADGQAAVKLHLRKPRKDPFPWKIVALGTGGLLGLMLCGLGAAWQTPWTAQLVLIGVPVAVLIAAPAMLIYRFRRR